MAILCITAKSRRLACLPGLEPSHPGEVFVGPEKAEDCEGLACGERPEMALSAKEYAKWAEYHAERPPLKSHSHLVAYGLDPETRRSVTLVPRG